MRTRSAGALAPVIATVVAVLTLAPLLLLVLAGAMSPRQFAASGLGMPTPWTWANVTELVRDPHTLLLPMLTTAAAAAVVALVQTVSSVLAAYAFARVPFPGRRVLFVLTLAGYLVPPAVTIVPLSIAFARAGLAGGFAALVLPFAFASPFAVLLLWRWFVRLPGEVLDAAALDGAGLATVLWRIVLPLSRPAVAVTLLVAAASTWNSYLWPRLIAGVRLPQVGVAIAALQTEHQSNWTLVMAAAGLVLIPTVIAALLIARPLFTTIDLSSEHR